MKFESETNLPSHPLSNETWAATRTILEKPKATLSIDQERLEAIKKVIKAGGKWTGNHEVNGVKFEITAKLIGDNHE